MSNNIPDYEKLDKLTPLEHVRLRPGMYFGGTDQRALHNLVWEVLENAAEQAHIGFCNQIEVTLYDDHKISISDNGKGIPIELYKDSGQSVFELVMTERGGRHFNVETKTFNGGLFGVGLAAVNALSDECEARVKRDGYLWQQNYVRGRKQTAMEKVRPLANDEQSGTTITFKPDFSILEPHEFNYDWLYRRLREVAAVIPTLKTRLIDKRSTSAKASIEFTYPRLADYVQFLNRDYTPLHPLIAVVEQYEIEQPKFGRKPYGISIELALQFVQSNENMVLSFVNAIDVNSGKHLWGFFTALLKVINAYAYQQKLVPNSWYFARSHLMASLTAVINIWHPHPSFESQTHMKLINPEMENITYDMTLKVLEMFAEQHPDEMRWIVEKCLANKAQREQRRYGR